MKGKAKALEFKNEEYSIHVIGRHVEVTEPMKQYAIEKVSKMEKFSSRIIDVVITMDIQKLEHRVHIDVRVNHIYIRSEATSEDMYKSIDLAVDKLKRQIARYHNKLVDHQGKNLAMVDMKVNVVKMYQDEVAAFNDEIESDNNRPYAFPEIVSEEKITLKTLPTDVAIMRLDLSGDHFLIYRCEEDKRCKVMYRRNDGHFGIVEMQE